MDYLRIKHSDNLYGSVKISGAKNSALPLIAATILSKNDVVLENLPNVVDVKVLIKLLTMLGASSKDINENSVSINTNNINNTQVVYDMVRKMRASILLLGPLLARFRKCQVSLPGGCAIGARPVDLHIKAMGNMGADIHITNGYINASAPKGLKGSNIIFDKITVTGTENVIMAAALAKGTTIITNPAKEPEIIQLCDVLRQAGVEISGQGSNEIVIVGSDGELLDFKNIEIIPDRIEAGTYLCAGAITNSSITINNVIPKHLEAITNKLKEIGFGIEVDSSSITILKARELSGFEITTSEYPGFPTDMQAQFMALATQCNGVSTIKERLFENRFMHVNELQRLGANISLLGNVANISGRSNLIGADVMATDLRASSALILAALIASGETRIHRIYHLDRGYEKIEQKLSTIGVKIERLKGDKI
ncbi:UDP-N-acetylglucosamine 1-carboxyvinyltransferase [Helicobacter sp. MIT 99-5507]|uniref:UDP-N-acetylglucosamine 1-carboxyvinyltransferase n=1 Tax=Helicobacter sp. MIT 99-5507 TaxID=152489 RepID=UPI000E1F090D|nr:UDP-N-acetylglucosamine 1-carboxyvinyltransferase [Helicobacter sp. MIT 99-5507]RDU57896.1 UDP-N-acetylglucosamine 1-carboxyvinyltransferase [Helicobacter sp. MIT 99-5507]